MRSDTNKLCEVDGENYIYFAAEKVFRHSPKHSTIIERPYNGPVASLDEFGRSNLGKEITEDCFSFGILKVYSQAERLSDLTNWARKI